MASRYSFEEDLSCPVCCDIFINPVVLSCSHSVCEDCIQRFWESKRLKECPVCRRRSSKEHPPVNLALKNLCKTYQQKPSQRSSFGGESVCGLHKEKLKLFCLDDEEPVCLVCRDSRKHTDHRFCPIDEAVMDNKEILKDALEYLKKNLRIFENFKPCFIEDEEQIKFNAQQAERQINKEFEELHQFLRDEEAARIKALREEEEQRSQMMKERTDETNRQISSLSCIIRDIEEQMNADDVSFLQNFNATLQRARCNPPIPEPSPAVKISFSKHLTNLKLTVLQKMQEIFGETSYFNIEQSHVQSELAAMAISDNPEEYNEYERFTRDKDRGNSSELFGGQQSRENQQQLPREVRQPRGTRGEALSPHLGGKRPLPNRETGRQIWRTREEIGTCPSHSRRPDQPVSPTSAAAVLPQQKRDQHRVERSQRLPSQREPSGCGVCAARAAHSAGKRLPREPLPHAPHPGRPRTDHVCPHS